MSKIATRWKTQRGSDTVAPDNSGFSLLLEDGGNVLLEDGGELLLEDSVVTPKHATEWSLPTKQRTAWERRDGSSTSVTGVSENRVTEDGELRITEAGEQRVTEDTRFDKKPRTEWRDE